MRERWDWKKVSADRKYSKKSSSLAPKKWHSYVDKTSTIFTSIKTNFHRNRISSKILCAVRIPSLHFQLNLNNFLSQTFHIKCCQKVVFFFHSLFSFHFPHWLCDNLSVFLWHSKMMKAWELNRKKNLHFYYWKYKGKLLRTSF